MLPRNKLRHDRTRKLQVFPDAAHPFDGHPRLVPFEMPPRNVRVPRNALTVPKDFDWEALWKEAVGEEEYKDLAPLPVYDPAMHGPSPTGSSR